ncbi:GIY-YIG nuclease family protein [Emcibacter sp.]|uniref:GIY-YIG nuclease family protein n=1 Tax=Emcibacter sp. TaxID=1979954 RepID=UPI002AA6B920|nr:GIY-YIG nuclease family protein [Emcibacter sp.]
MLTFNSALREVDINPEAVKLVRHKDTRFKITPYSLFYTEPEKYHLYNANQQPKKFDLAEFIASFVVSPDNSTLFTGLYKLDGFSHPPDDFVCPVSLEPSREFKKNYFYNLSPVDELAEYKGRLIIDWGGGERAWVQWANRRPKKILEILREFHEPSFPGFQLFSCSLDRLNTIPESWKQVLRSVNGVYLMVHLDTKQLYVGSASGQNGIWGRWENYIRDGHGGNRELKKLGSRNFQLSILEVCSSSATNDEIIVTENRWKEKLLSRSLGLNAN